MTSRAASPSALRQFLERSGKKVAPTTNGSAIVSSGHGNSHSPSCGSENWANFDSLSLPVSWCDPRKPHSPTASAAFEEFESSTWNFWVVSHRSGHEDGEEDDVVGTWMSRLLPSRSTPLLRRNPRDSHRRCPFVRRNAFYGHNQHNSMGEHLSNEEWIAQRRRRERSLRQRYQQEAERQLGMPQEQIFFRSESNPDDIHEWGRARRSVDQRLLFLQRDDITNMVDGQILLSNGALVEEEERPEQNPSNDPPLPLAERGAEISTQQSRAAQSTGPGHTSTQEASRHPELRHRARLAPVTVQARRDRIRHWSSSAAYLSLDLVLLPWRLVARNANENDTIRNNVGNDHSRDGTISYSDERGETSSNAYHEDHDGVSSTRGVNSSSSGSSSVVETIGYVDHMTELPPFPSGGGWRHDQDVDYDDDGSRASRFWSTGTAMETDSDSSVDTDGSNCDMDDREQRYREETMPTDMALVDIAVFRNEWPPSDDNLLRLYDATDDPTIDDTLFPDDPFPDLF